MQEDMIAQPLDEGRLVFTFTRYPNPSRFLFIFKWLFSISGFAKSEASSFWHIWPQLGNVPALQQNNKLRRNERMSYICCDTERSYSLKYSASLFPGSVIALLKFHQVATWAGLPRPFSLHTWYLSLLSQGWGWSQTNYIESIWRWDRSCHSQICLLPHLIKKLPKK